MIKQLTIITDPRFELNNIFHVLKKLKNSIRIFLIFLKLYPDKIIHKKYGGHYGVTRSLIEGLQKIGADFNYNPKHIREYAENVIVLSSIEALKQAIELKKYGKIIKLLAGPNLLVNADDEDCILASDEIDICIVPSNWSAKVYEIENPDLTGRIKYWPAGVDESFWEPINNKKTKNVILYWKRPDINLFHQVENKLLQFGYNPIKLIYGKYTVSEYKNLLESCCFLVHFVDQESQGISLLEAWSMNVPTLVWNPGQSGIIKYYHSNISSAPYLTDETGLFFNDIAKFQYILENITEYASKFEPRKWVLNNLTDVHSAKKLLSIAGIQK